MQIPLSPDGEADEPAYKKVRKGTHSCVECRRRKIKCTFANAQNTRPCIECRQRDLQCEEQVHSRCRPKPSKQLARADDPSGLKDRIRKLEGSLSRVLDSIEHLPPSAQDSTFANGAAKRKILAAERGIKRTRSLEDAAFEEPETDLVDGSSRAPALSLFDNNIFSRVDEALDSLDSNQRLHAKPAEQPPSMVDSLSALLPRLDEIYDILDFTNGWAYFMKPYTILSPARDDTAVKAEIKAALDSGHAVRVAKVISCLAVSLNHLPVDWRASNKTDGSWKAKADTYYKKIDRLVASDDQLVCSIPGIELLILQAKYQIFMGRPLKSWMLFRRAMNLAQMLGLHRVANEAVPEDKSAEWWQQAPIWLTIWPCERYLSLLLGLPYGCSNQWCGPALDKENSSAFALTDGELYMDGLHRIISKVIDLHADVNTATLTAIMNVDQQLELIANARSLFWWAILESDENAEHPEDHFHRRVAQFYHHYIRCSLHMPFMLKSLSDPKYTPCRDAALQASRNMIRYYGSMRRRPRGDTLRGSFMDSPASKMLGFQAFTAAVLLLLNILGHSDGPSATDVTHDQEQVKQVLAILEKETAADQTNIIAAQSSQALKLLLQAHDRSNSGIERLDKPISISIPFFGRISIRASSRQSTKTSIPLTSPSSTTHQSSSSRTECIPTWPTPSRSISNSSHTSITSPITTDSNSNSNFWVTFDSINTTTSMPPTTGFAGQMMPPLPSHDLLCTTSNDDSISNSNLFASGMPLPGQASDALPNQFAFGYQNQLQYQCPDLDQPWIFPGF